jgi:hypothetical protein
MNIDCYPELSLRSNSGLKLANAFGVIQTAALLEEGPCTSIFDWNVILGEEVI